MAEDLSKKRLGRGLAALIGEMDKPAAVETKAPALADGRVPIEFVSPNPKNPRRHFGDSELTDLTQSIREHGIVQPVLVRRRDGGRYEIIAGERRWRAAQAAGLTDIPVLVRDVDDRTSLELAIIENVQRADLNPVEEALGYQQLIDEHNYSQADLGQVIGKSRSHVANTLRLLKLPDVIRDMLVDGELSAGHARTLVNASDPAGLAKRIVEDGLSVRQAEALAQQPESGRAPRTQSAPQPKDADTLALEKMLGDVTGLSVSISHKEKGGEVRIAYRTLEQLDDLCRRLQQ
ncbi:MAG: ParB/RepB/Spo0J family partition protein [Alphaproteobacteria bacterium]|nr:ParB/RepB/Spo0J family partition protein [Alphaproteobacteria bacterium]MBU0804689.1 ParB/RepB/Spo0J family partition protein [Alphaproteobacteria bacterium]MBU0870074.1 ParB/RepB/Spo0J family partition protein [Alphaproteobacteria bacterium]MBU1401101.1 ParB/RepB/Spo0J family partition protein [Alphaproteobacteria bacterium]MBU1592482.1 ParB/RepB/Spo0J family partition protein [Alphaproteobacteria bacterium]